MRSDQIEFFMSCAACLNFSLAAKYHFVSVSTLSRSINALEDELGLKLFNRGYHGHKLTEAGEAFLKICMESSQVFNNFAKDWSIGRGDNLLIGCEAYNDSFELLISAYSKVPGDFLPKKIKVNLMPGSGLKKSLDAGLVDAVLIEANIEADSSEYKSLPFCRAGEREYILLSKHELSDSIFEKLSRLGSMLI